MPRHLHFVEPFFGGGAVLLERDPNDQSLWASECAQRGGVSEVANDISGDLVNFWRVLRHPAQFPQFLRMCQATPLSRAAFDEAGEVLAAEDDEIMRAHAFFVRCRQSRAGTFKGFTSLSRSRTRRGINGNASEWLGAIDGLPAVHARLQPVVIENMDAFTLIRREDGPDTFQYLDPPYLHETRVTKDAYAHEMTAEEHGELLVLLSTLKGKFLLSGYPSDLYYTAADTYGWRCVEIAIPNHAAGGKTKKRMTECLWANYNLPTVTWTS